MFGYFSKRVRTLAEVEHGREPLEEALGDGEGVELAEGVGAMLVEEVVVTLDVTWALGLQDWVPLDVGSTDNVKIAVCVTLGVLVTVPLGVTL